MEAAGSQPDLCPGQVLPGLIRGPVGSLSPTTTLAVALASPDWPAVRGHVVDALLDAPHLPAGTSLPLLVALGDERIDRAMFLKQFQTTLGEPGTEPGDGETLNG